MSLCGCSLQSHSCSCDDHHKKHKKEVIKGDLEIKGNLILKGHIITCNEGNILPLSNTFTQCIVVNGNPALYAIIPGTNALNITLEQGFILRNLGRTLHFAIPPTGNSDPVSINVISPFTTTNNSVITTTTLTAVPPFSFDVYINLTSLGPYVEIKQ